MKYNITHGSILDWAASYSGPKFHALLCDPPYHLTEITKRFGKADSAPAQYGSDGAFQRTSKGFMGKTWDGGRIAFEPETWVALAEHLHPGAYGMAFASTRGYHRMACAIEDAGLIIHTMLGWSFGSGFPKATRVDTQIDKRAGAERATIGERKHAPKFDAKRHGYREKDNGYNSRERESFALTAPATELAAAWEGHRYGGQAIKPAFEPIVLFQKPYQDQPVESITQTGAGAINVDGARVAAPGGKTPGGRGKNGGLTGWQPSADYDESIGRWPANLLLSHNADCNGQCTPGCAVQALGAQSGKSVSRQGMARIGQAGQGWSMAATGAEYDDAGTAARFFYNTDWMLDRLDTQEPVRYVAKASTSEREAGLEAFEPSTVDDGRAKSIDNPYQRGETERRNTHPTIKPIDLCRYLATLLLPPGLYAPRRLLVPFSGSGSEMIGAGLAGWEECEGIELEAEHIAIARARLAHWVDVFADYRETAA
jgi:hypothetical protein